MLRLAIDQKSTYIRDTIFFSHLSPNNLSSITKIAQAIFSSIGKKGVSSRIRLMAVGIAIGVGFVVLYRKNKEKTQEAAVKQTVLDAQGFKKPIVVQTHNKISSEELNESISVDLSLMTLGMTDWEKDKVMKIIDKTPREKQKLFITQAFKLSRFCRLGSEKVEIVEILSRILPEERKEFVALGYNLSTLSLMDWERAQLINLMAHVAQERRREFIAHILSVKRIKR